MNRLAYVLSAGCASVAMIVPAITSPVPRLIWNASASVPPGLYLLHRAASARVGDLVAVFPPRTLGTYLARRRYLPLGLPLLKHVAARPGQSVCRLGRHILIDRRGVGEALERDRQGRPLPVWRGCRRLRPSQIFVMNEAVRDSFDGRYFGPLPTSAIAGRLTPIWTR